MARVLLVDDEPSVRAALKELVQSRGCLDLGPALVLAVGR